MEMNRELNYNGPIYIFRSGGDQLVYMTDHKMEKRQLFLRSYQFSRKESLSERIKKSFGKVKRLVCFRLRSAKKIRKMVWSKLRHGLFHTRRNRRSAFLRLQNATHASTNGLSWPSSSSFL